MEVRRRRQQPWLLRDEIKLHDSFATGKDAAAAALTGFDFAAPDSPTVGQLSSSLTAAGHAVSLAAQSERMVRHFGRHLAKLRTDVEHKIDAVISAVHGSPTSMTCARRLSNDKAEDELRAVTKNIEEITKSTERMLQAQVLGALRKKLKENDVHLGRLLAVQNKIATKRRDLKLRLTESAVRCRMAADVIEGCGAEPRYPVPPSPPAAEVAAFRLTDRGAADDISRALSRSSRSVSSVGESLSVTPRAVQKPFRTARVAAEVKEFGTESFGSQVTSDSADHSAMSRPSPPPPQIVPPQPQPLHTVQGELTIRARSHIGLRTSKSPVSPAAKAAIAAYQKQQRTAAAKAKQREDQIKRIENLHKQLAHELSKVSGVDDDADEALMRRGQAVKKAQKPTHSRLRNAVLALGALSSPWAQQGRSTTSVWGASGGAEPDRWNARSITTQLSPEPDRAKLLSPVEEFEVEDLPEEPEKRAELLQVGLKDDVEAELLVRWNRHGQELPGAKKALVVKEETVVAKEQRQVLSAASQLVAKKAELAVIRDSITRAAAARHELLEKERRRHVERLERERMRRLKQLREQRLIVDRGIQCTVDQEIQQLEVKRVEALLRREHLLRRELANVKVAAANVLAFNAVLEVDLTCSHCFEIISSPEVMWPCGHTFCHRCINRMHKDGEGYKCSECGVMNAEGSIPNGTLEAVVTRWTLGGGGTTDLEMAIAGLQRELGHVDKSLRSGWQPSKHVPAPSAQQSPVSEERPALISPKQESPGSPAKPRRRGRASVLSSPRGETASLPSHKSVAALPPSKKFAQQKQVQRAKSPFARRDKSPH